MIDRNRTGEVVHVAADGENRGRVVLRVHSGRPHPLAVDVAIRIAQAYHARLESLFVEEPQLVDGAAHPFVREVLLSGRATQSFDVRDVEAILGYEARRARRYIEARAQAASVPFALRVTRDESVRALSVACTEDGPWNVIVLADAFSPMGHQALAQMLDLISGATAVVAVGPRATRTVGPIVVAVENADRLESMLRLAERLAGEEPDRSPIRILLVTETVAACGELEAHVRLALAGHSDTLQMSSVPTLGAPDVAIEAVRRSGAGLVIAQAGGLLIGADDHVRMLAQCLECPIVLVR